MHDSDEIISALLADSCTITVVGLSAKPDRPSHGVAWHLQSHSYRITRINPAYAGTHLLGEHCDATLTSADVPLDGQGAAIDVVDCLRRSDQAESAFDDTIAVGARAVRMQPGVINHAAAAKAWQTGLLVIMDRAAWRSSTCICNDVPTTTGKTR